MRHSLIFLPSYKDSIRPLDDESRLLMYDALVDYAVDGIEPNLPLLLNSLFLSFKPIIDNGIKKYDAAVKNGKKGGAPKGNKNAKKNNQKTTSEQPVKQPKTTQNNQEVEEEVEVEVEDEVEVKEEKDTRPAGPDSRSRPCMEKEMETGSYPNIDVEAEEGWEEEPEPKPTPKPRFAINAENYADAVPENEEERKEFWLKVFKGGKL